MFQPEYTSGNLFYTAPLNKKNIVRKVYSIHKVFKKKSHYHKV